MVIGMACDKEPKEELEMRPIIALRNSKPYNCLEVYEKVRQIGPIIRLIFHLEQTRRDAALRRLQISTRL